MDNDAELGAEELGGAELGAADPLRGFLDLSLDWQLRASTAYQAVWLWSAYANEQDLPRERSPTPDEAAVALVLAIKLRESDLVDLAYFARGGRHQHALQRLECSVLNAALSANASRTPLDRALEAARQAGLTAWRELDFCGELALFEPALRSRALAESGALLLAAACLAQAAGWRPAQAPHLELQPQSQQEAALLLSGRSETATLLASKYGVSEQLRSAALACLGQPVAVGQAKLLA